MKSRKGIILIGMMLSISLLTMGCMKSLEEKIGTKIGEKIIEKVTDGEVSIDTKDGFSIETEGGSMKTGENLKWPKDKMDPLPEPKATIVSITEFKEEESTSVILAFEKKNAGSDYMEKLIDLGYIQRMLTTSDEHVMYMGIKDDNTSVTYTYQPNEEYGSITLNRNDSSAMEFFESEAEEEEEPLEIDLADSMDWPKDVMDDIPPIKAQITSISQDSDFISIGYKNIREKDINSYIEEVKSIGFDLNPSTMIMEDFISYSGFNKKDFSISITWMDNSGTLNYIKNR